MPERLFNASESPAAGGTVDAGEEGARLCQKRFGDVVASAREHLDGMAVGLEQVALLGHDSLLVAELAVFVVDKADLHFR